MSNLIYYILCIINNIANCNCNHHHYEFYQISYHCQTCQMYCISLCKPYHSQQMALCNYHVSHLASLHGVFRNCVISFCHSKILHLAYTNHECYYMCPYFMHSHLKVLLSHPIIIIKYHSNIVVLKYYIYHKLCVLPYTSKCCYHTINVISYYHHVWNCFIILCTVDYHITLPCCRLVTVHIF